VFSFGEREGQCYLVMELLERGSLDDRLTKVGKVPEKEVIDIGIQIAGGLKAAYECGLLHRDVKPGNILFGEQGVPKIVDFGLARPKDASTKNEPIWGTPFYIAPEKLLGQQEDFRSDIYSLGATLFHAMAGRPPFDAATAVDVAVKHTTTPAYSLKTYLPTVHPMTATVIGRMLAKDPLERYASYDKLIVDLERAKAQLAQLEKTKTVVTSSGERVSVASVVSTLVTLVVVGVGAMLLWAYRDRLFGETTSPSVPPTVVIKAKNDEVNFAKDQPYGKTWHEAAAKVAEGRISEALLDYESLGRQLPSQPNHLRWVLYAEGMALQLSGQFEESRKKFIRAEDPLMQSQLPPQITPNNFISPLTSAALDKLSAAELERAATNMPSWAVGLADFSIGLAQLRAGDLNVACTHFQHIRNVTFDDSIQWAQVFQTIAIELIRECNDLKQILSKVEDFRNSNNLFAAQQQIQQASVKRRFPVYQAFLQRAAVDLKKQIDDRREEKQQASAVVDARAKEEQEQKALEERRQRDQQEVVQSEQLQELAAADKTTIPFLAIYDFKSVQTKYTTLNGELKGQETHRQIAQRLARIQLLVEFKKQLGDSFVLQPLANPSILTRANTPVAGTLSRASDTEMIFTTPYGEIPMRWSDFAPATIVKLAEAYIATFSGVEPPPAGLARRYLALAVFCKEYRLDRYSGAYIAKAIKLQPSLQAELEQALGKPTE
jgi:serine/threonine protein kinase